MSGQIYHPKHYNMSRRETISTIRDCLTGEEYQGFLVGNVLKYLGRYKHKGDPMGDISKAIEYLGMLLVHLGNEAEKAEKVLAELSETITRKEPTPEEIRAMMHH